MDLVIEQSCPSCGAPVTLHESDTVVQCEFCDVKNYMVTGGVRRFVLPHKIPVDIPESEVFHVPYIRFKGNIFSCRGKKLEYKILDTTHLGFNAADLPISLGLRPQAMKIIPVTSALEGRFLIKDDKIQDIFLRAANVTNSYSQQAGNKLYHQAFIGETISYIYLPTYMKEGYLYDGVLNKKITEFQIEPLERNGGKYNSNWEPKFLSTICPHCADTLTAEQDSLVLTCNNCFSAWEEKGGEYKKVAWSVVAGKFKGFAHLPFWKITPRFDGVKLHSFADLLRLTNHPTVIHQRHEELDICIWVPAFKIRPKYLLHLARGVTFTQADIPASNSSSPLSNSFPVTLPLKEAKQALKSILADSGLNKKMLFPMLPEIVLKKSKSQLIFLPFNDRGHDYVQEHTGVTLAKAILRFARKL